MAIIDRIADRVVAKATGIPKLFYQGIGDPELINQLVEQTHDFGPPGRLEMHWEGSKRHRDGSHTLTGWFQSPTQFLPLPPEVRTAQFQLLLPADAFDVPRPRICVHLAGTGDSTFAARRFLAKPLLHNPDPARRIGALILQNPYYGHRAPHGQYQTRLRRLVDQFLMNLATIYEARALLGWLRQEGFERVGVTGYSMGGITSGYTAQTVPFPVAAIPCAAGDSAVATLLYSPLRQMVDWKKLAEESGGLQAAEMMLSRILGALALSERPAPVAPEAAIILGVKDDLFIPIEQPRALHEHWKGSELRWMRGGHTTGWLLHSGEIRQAISDAFDRLDLALAEVKQPARNLGGG